MTISYDNKLLQEAAIGEGTIDAIFKAIDRVTNIQGHLVSYDVSSVTKGKDALAKVTVKVLFENGTKAVLGQGLNIDTMVASSHAYLSALNLYIDAKGK